MHHPHPILMAISVGVLLVFTHAVAYLSGAAWMDQEELSATLMEHAEDLGGWIDWHITRRAHRVWGWISRKGVGCECAQCRE